MEMFHMGALQITSAGMSTSGAEEITLQTHHNHTEAHQEQAFRHHHEAARHLREAAKYHEAGDRKTAIYYAHIAQAHALYASDHTSLANKQHGHA